MALGILQERTSSFSQVKLVDNARYPLYTNIVNKNNLSRCAFGEADVVLQKDLVPARLTFSQLLWQSTIFVQMLSLRLFHVERAFFLLKYVKICRFLGKKICGNAPILARKNHLFTLQSVGNLLLTNNATVYVK